MKINKKKFQVLAVAGVLTVGIVGGTLAWFTSQDKVTNEFATGSIKDKDTDGVKIEEIFKKPENMLPGDKEDKRVQVKNTASYDQFIRVKLTPKFVDVTNNRSEIKQVNMIDKDKNEKTVRLDTNNIILNLANFAKDNKKEDGHWFKSGDYYYYIGKVAPDSHTNKLLESVTLNQSAGNEYRDIGFDIDVETDSIQATNDAYKDWVKDSHLQNEFARLQNGNATNPTDSINEKDADVNKKLTTDINETTSTDNISEN